MPQLLQKRWKLLDNIVERRSAALLQPQTHVHLAFAEARSRKSVFTKRPSFVAQRG